VSEGRLEELRARIRALDRELVALIGRRRDQEARVVRRAAEIARELGVDEELTRDVIWRIIASARDVQEGRSRWGPPLPTDEPDSAV
jgi:chorismate mutase